MKIFHNLRCAALAGAATILAGLFLQSAALANDFPTKSVTLVVPFPAGGGTDVVARALGIKFGELLGAPIVVENRPGAGTILGASNVAKSAPDGYTLLLTSGTTFTVNPAVYSKLPYDVKRDFEPIGLVGLSGLIILANKSVPVSNVKELVALAKASPGKYTYASFGAGTTAHFAGEEFLNLTGIKLLHVPYKGSAPAMTDLIGGQVSFSVDTVTAAIPQLESGTVKPIAVTMAKRSDLLPDVPTVAESGYPEMDASSWLAVFAPHGIPSNVREKLERALADTVSDPETRRALAISGIEAIVGDGALVNKMIDHESPRMHDLARRANIKVQ